MDLAHILEIFLKGKADLDLSCRINLLELEIHFCLVCVVYNEDELFVVVRLVPREINDDFDSVLTVCKLGLLIHLYWLLHLAVSEGRHPEAVIGLVSPRTLR